MLVPSRSAYRLIPVIRTGCRRAALPRRCFWGSRWDPMTDMRSIVGQMERQMEHLDRDMNRFFQRMPFPPRFSRTLPIETSEMMDKYTINVDMTGFRPEDIKVSIKDRVLTIRAKMDARGEDGSHVSQQVERQYTLPESVDMESLRSALTSDGILTIQAPQALPEPPKDIPIEKDVEMPETEKAEKPKET